MRADRRDPTIAALRRFKPTKFEATLRDGAKKSLALSTKQNRWELLSDTLEVMPWVTIEALDNDGQVLGCIERETDGELVEGDGDAVDQVERLSRIMLNVMTTTQVETRKMFADSMRVHAEMATSMLESMRVVQDSYSLAMKIQATAAVAGPGEEDNVMKMMQMAMALKMGATPSVTVAATPPPAKPRPTPPKNGA